MRKLSDYYQTFAHLIEKGDLAASKAYIIEHVFDLDDVTRDAMVVDYEFALLEKYPEYAERYVVTDYFNAINDTVDEKYILHIDKIADPIIREEVLSTVDLGYTFEMMEGAYYLAVDYKLLDETFGPVTTKVLSDYYVLKAYELDNPIYVEEYVGQAPNEIREGLVVLEALLEAQADIKNREEVVDMLRWYTQALLTVDLYSGTVDYETGAVENSVKEAYRWILDSDLKVSKDAIMTMNTYLESIEYTIDTDNAEVITKLVDIKFAEGDAIETKVDAYYPKQ